MKKDKSKQNNSGQLLIEAMVAVSLMIIGLLGVFAVLSQSLGLNRVATDQFIAVHIAAEGVEVVKNMIDKDAREKVAFAQSINRTGKVTLDYTTDLSPDGYEMEAFSEGSPAYLKFDKTTGLYGHVSGEDTKFTRYVEISREDIDPTDEDDELIRVKSVVEWPSRGGLQGHVEVEDTFYDWRHLP